MRIYNSASDMVREVERELFEMGHRYQTETVQDKRVAGDSGYQTIELNGYCYMLQDNSHSGLVKMLEYAKANVVWCEAELIERLHSPSNPGVSWEAWPEMWGQFLRDGKFAYTYSERWGAQISYVVNELVRRPNTRQAIISMYESTKDMMNWGGRDRVPCSLTYQFLNRGGKLNLIYNQRSCDFVSFFAPDVYFAMGLMKEVADRVGLEWGNLTHCIGSLHAFAKDLEGRGIF